MATPRTFERSLATAHSQPAAFTGTLPMPLPDLFAQRYGPIPPIREVRDQSGPWQHADQTRTIALVGGGTMRETLTTVESPRSFSYVLTQLTGPLALLASQIDGQWRFTPTGAGTTITWRWTVHPRGAAGALLLPAFERLWQGYAARALARLNHLLSGHATA